MATLDWQTTDLGNSCDVSIKLAAHICIVGEYEGLVRVETDGKDVFRILSRVLLDLFDLPLLVE